MGKSKFTVTYTIEVEHEGDVAELEYVETAAADMFDFALARNGGRFPSAGLTIVDGLGFAAEAE